MQKADITTFEIKDCALISIATGKKAINTKEFFTQLLNIEGDSIYYHFWAKLIRTSFSTPEYNNDFAQWIFKEMHDLALAERLSILEPQYFESIEDLRQEMLDIIESSLEQNTALFYTNAKEPFYFMKYGLVVFNTNKFISDPKELKQTIGSLSLGSLYFHFIDARIRTPNNKDDFSNWLKNFEGYEPLMDSISDIDPFFLPLSKLKERLLFICEKFCK